MRKYIFLFIILILMPFVVFAQNNDLAVAVKYYKTTNVMEDNNFVKTIDRSVMSYTSEITEEEYESYKDEFSILPLDTTNGYTETNYKKMTTSIVKNGSTYRYKVVLEWKNMPSTRSYDVIGLGFAANVKPESVPFFSQKYCYTNGRCYTENVHTRYVGTYGVGASFSLPVGKLSSLKQTLYVDIKKSNSSNTIIKQYAYGDYSHATKIISYSNAKKYNVGLNGIVFDSSVINYYDSIHTANAVWTGTW